VLAPYSRRIWSDTLIQLDLAVEEFSTNAFAGDEKDFPENFPLSCVQIAQAQPNDPELMDHCANSDLCDKKVHKHACEQCELIACTESTAQQSKIIILKSLQRKSTEWCHLHLLHSGETGTEWTISQHCHWKDVSALVTRVCRTCEVCRHTKARNLKCGVCQQTSQTCCPGTCSAST
jgi:hypothetical protein